MEPINFQEIHSNLDKQFLKKAITKKLLPEDATIENLTQEIKEQLVEIANNEKALSGSNSASGNTGGPGGTGL